MDQTDQAVSEILRQLADNLGVALPHLYDVLVTQHIWLGWANLIQAVLGVTCFFLFVRHGISLIRRNAEGQPASDTEEVVTIVGTAFFLIMTIIIYLAFPDMLGHLVNPEYYAIQDLLEAIGK